MTGSRTRRRWLAWLLGSFLAVGTLFLAASTVLETAWFRRQLAKAVEVALEGATGETAAVGAVAVEPWSGRVRISGLVLSHEGAGGGAGGSPLLAVEQVTAELGFDGRRPLLRRLVVDRPAVRLHLDPDGL
jgi:hypothetical protein